MKTKALLYRTLYLTGRVLSIRRLMLFAGASLLATTQACKTAPKMCYEMASPDTTASKPDTVVVEQHYDSLYRMIDCYEKPNFPDTINKAE